MEIRVDEYTCEMLPPEGEIELKPQEYEVYDTVDRFNKELIAYMNHPQVEVENAMPSATQELGHSYYLQKKRILKRGMSVHYARFRHDQFSSISTKCYDFINARKQTVCWERQRILHDIRYVRNGRVLRRDNEDKILKHYVFRAKNAQGLYFCPSCGAEQALEALLDGCDYCKSQFDINAYKDYVASVSYDRSTKYSGSEKRKKDLKEVLLGQFVFVMILGLISFIIGMKDGTFAGDYTKIVEIFLGILFSFSFFIMIYGCLVVYYLMKNRDVKKYDAIYDAIRNCNPDFDMDEFVSSMDSKIKAVYYATDKTDISAFVLCQTDEFLKQNQNVIACMVSQIELLGFRTEGMYQYVDVFRGVNLLRDMGNEITYEHKNMYLTLCKKRNYKMKRDAVMYRCPNCGSSISLKTGGICQYCNSQIDYLLYDWAIVGAHFKDKPPMLWDKREDGELW